MSTTSARRPMARNYGSVKQETDSKLAVLRAWLDRRGLAGTALTSPAAVAWLTAGITNAIDRTAPASPLWLVVTPDRVVAITTAVERPRLAAEAGLDELGFRLEDVPWYEPEAFSRVAEEVAGVPWEELRPDEDDLTAMRLQLLPAEQERLAALGSDVARALEHAVSSWRPGERDLDAQARLVEGLERAGAMPVCIIVGGDERVKRFRHPLAVGARIERLLMAVVVAMRGGLHAAATRLACAGEMPPELQAAFAAALQVEAAMLDAHRPGATYGGVMLACAEAYAASGHPGAWEEHYQGGPIGYRQREFEPAPSQRDSRWFAQPIEIGHAVAWNPSVIGGGKIEDTFLVEEDGLRCVTETGSWPQVQAAGARPRSGILEIAP
ncbi:MAG: hypothetical protein C5B48_01570 [Candidatus Rokuibacteriota bacterium]|nr:MAG: hypothetical protein C5B48_01570 [Candidatus Rokubacteria bacterium]